MKSRLSTTGAAFAVLKASRKPLSAREIATKAAEKGLWSTTGKTPWDSIASQIYVDIKKNGADSRFVIATRKPTTFSLKGK